MTWFLRLFKAFRDLESRRTVEMLDLQAAMEELVSERDSLTTERDSLLRQLETATSDRTQMWEMVNKALEGERTAYQMHINASWQKQGGGVPYPAAPSLAPNAVPVKQEPGPVGRTARVLPSQLVRQRTNDFISGVLAEREQAG